MHLCRSTLSGFLAPRSGRGNAFGSVRIATALVSLVRKITKTKIAERIHRDPSSRRFQRSPGLSSSPKTPRSVMVPLHVFGDGGPTSRWPCVRSVDQLPIYRGLSRASLSANLRNRSKRLARNEGASGQALWPTPSRLF